MQDIHYPGTLFTVSAPSGAGKTSLVNAWLERNSNLQVSVSYTTRPQREGEINGEDYHFINVALFERMISEHEFFEYAKVFNNYYGTTKQGIVEQLSAGVDVVLEIDWQGANQVKRLYSKTVSIFVLPPSYEVLRERLVKRGREHDAEIQIRLKQAKQEMQHYAEADYLLINDEFEQALDNLCAIQRVANLKTANQRFHHQQMLQQLID